MKDSVRLPSLSAALAGIPAGIQPLGPWTGRRQLFVKFAGEAETATIYTADALRGELKRSSARSKYHSIAVVGPDALIEVEFLAAAMHTSPLPVMLDHDGQRPSVLEALLPTLSLVQVSMDGKEGAAAVERVCSTMEVAAKARVAHAVAIQPAAAMSDGPLLRIVEQLHRVSAEAQVVLHVTPESVAENSRRWVLWLQEAMAVHDDVRVLPRWPVAASGSQEGGAQRAV